MVLNHVILYVSTVPEPNSTYFTIKSRSPWFQTMWFFMYLQCLTKFHIFYNWKQIAMVPNHVILYVSSVSDQVPHLLQLKADHHGSKPCDSLCIFSVWPSSTSFTIKSRSPWLQTMWLFMFLRCLNQVQHLLQLKADRHGSKLCDYSCFCNVWTKFHIFLQLKAGRHGSKPCDYSCFCNVWTKFNIFYNQNKSTWLFIKEN